MKLKVANGRDDNGPMGAGAAHRQSGMAVLLVLVMLAITEVFIICNTRVLDNLQRELRKLDQKQQQKYALPPAQTPSKP